MKEGITMNPKQKCFSHQFRFTDWLALAVAGLLYTWAGQTHATLFTPSVEATMSGSSWDCGGWLCPTVISSPLGPVVTGASPTDGQNASVFTNYGTHGAAVSMWAKRPYGEPMTGHWGWISAASKWTDVLTVSTPDVAPNAPIDVVFSLALHGHMETNRTSSVSVGGQVLFEMLLNGYGSWVAKPSLRHDLWESVPGNSYSLANSDPHIFGEPTLNGVV